jgi:hypothetical protein
MSILLRPDFCFVLTGRQQQQVLIKVRQVTCCAATAGGLVGCARQSRKSG